MYKIYHFDEQIMLEYKYVTVNYIKTENNFTRQFLPITLLAKNIGTIRYSYRYKLEFFFQLTFIK